MRQLLNIKIFIFLFVSTLPIFSNEQSSYPKTNCEKKDCKIEFKLIKKNKFTNLHKKDILSLKESLSKIKSQTSHNREVNKKWEERIEQSLHNQEKIEERKILNEIYEKEMKF